MSGKLTSARWGKIQKLRAAKRRRAKWTLAQVFGLGRVDVNALWVLHCAEHPKDAVSRSSFYREYRALRSLQRACPYCKQLMTAANVEVKGK